jgi:hypothetical protein
MELSKCAGPACTLIIWAAWQDLHQWQEAAETIGWQCEAAQLVTVRSNRASQGKRARGLGMRNVTEHAIVLHVGPKFAFHVPLPVAGQPKPKKKRKRRGGAPQLSKSADMANIESLLGKWDKTASHQTGYDTNVILNYDPPSGKERLVYEDGAREGRPVRPRGEKSV